jgi:two-component system, NarL family, response regulator YdfI
VSDPRETGERPVERRRTSAGPSEEMVQSLTTSEFKAEGRLTTVFIIAASDVVRAGLEALVGSDERFTVAGSAADWAGLLTEVPSADVVLVDLSDTSEVSIAQLRVFNEEVSDGEAPAFVVLISDLKEDRITTALGFNARAVLHRNSSSGEILAAIEGAAAGLIVMDRDVLDVLREVSASSPAQAATPSTLSEETGREVEQLTPREVEVLGMLAEGRANKEIAVRLMISEHTVKFHVSSIFAKLGVSSRTEAVTQGIRRGLIML